MASIRAHLLHLIPTLFVSVGAMAGCDSDSDSDSDGVLGFPSDAVGKADTFGRGLAGIASPYEPNPALAAPQMALAMESNLALRREIAWDTARKILEPVPLLGLAKVVGEHTELSFPNDEVPTVPRFQTWYGVDDFTRMFQHLYGELDEAQRRTRSPFEKIDIANAEVWNASAVERSDRWPLERYLRHVRQLGECPDTISDQDCVQLVQSQTAGATSGTSRILYSPGTIVHVLANYPQLDACMTRMDTLALDHAPQDPANNFTDCFSEEFPTDAVLVKAQWVRSDFGRDVAVYDTDAESLRTRLEGTALWGEDGDRRANPDASKIHTIRLRDGSEYRLAGLHIMTKELRHWQWVTLWWSESPQDDFGADRPKAFREALPRVWDNYKMCAVSFFDEKDPALAERFATLPGLRAAANASSSLDEPSWCSNPYLEHGRGNARTNCIGCHQHGGSTVAYDLDDDGDLDPLDLEAIISDEIRFPRSGTVQIRETFPADYLYSVNRIDNLAGVIRTEIEHYDNVAEEALRERIDGILASDRNPDSGSNLFAQDCRQCHGALGQGAGFAPNLSQRVPSLLPEQLVRSLIEGRGGMPAWGETLNDQQIADIYAYLLASFAQTAS